MPTLVRVRGKRRPKGAPEPMAPFTEKAPKKRRRSRDRVRTTSSLELLPTEILQEIFLLCPNFALPNSSFILHSKLTSEHIKKQLIDRYFARIDTSQGKSSRRLDTIRSVISGSTNVLTEEDIGRIQTSLVAAPWMDCTMMRNCQWTFYLQEGTKRLKYFLRYISQEEQEVQVVIFRNRITNYFNRFESEAPLDDHEYWSGYYEHRRHDGAIFKWYASGNRSGDNGSFDLRLRFNDHVDDQHTPAETLEKADRQLKQYHFIFPDIHPCCKLPRGLLKGPWTQGRGDILKLLMDNARDPDYEERGTVEHDDVTDEILLSAIKEKCFTALEYFNAKTSERLHSRWLCLGNMNAKAPQSYDLQWPQEGRRFPWLEAIERPEPYIPAYEPNNSTPSSIAELGPRVEPLPSSSRLAPWIRLKGRGPRLGESPVFKLPIYLRARHMGYALSLFDETGDEAYFLLFEWMERFGAWHETLKVEDMLEFLSARFRITQDGNVDKTCGYYRAWDLLRDTAP